MHMQSELKSQAIATVISHGKGNPPKNTQ